MISASCRTTRQSIETTLRSRRESTRRRPNVGRCIRRRRGSRPRRRRTPRPHRVLENRDQTRQTARVWPHRRLPLLRITRQSGVDDRHVSDAGQTDARATRRRAGTVPTTRPSLQRSTSASHTNPGVSNISAARTSDAGRHPCRPTSDQSSNRLGSFHGANCLIEIPRESGNLARGDSVDDPAVDGSCWVDSSKIAGSKMNRGERAVQLATLMSLNAFRPRSFNRFELLFSPITSSWLLSAWRFSS